MKLLGKILCYLLAGVVGIIMTLFYIAVAFLPYALAITFALWMYNTYSI